MENPNLKSANAHMSTMLEDLMEAGCVVLQAYLDREYNHGESWFRYHIQVLETPEFQQWHAMRSYRGSYSAKHDRYSIPFPDGEVFHCV